MCCVLVQGGGRYGSVPPGQHIHSGGVWGGVGGVVGGGGGGCGVVGVWGGGGVGPHHLVANVVSFF